jgi:hypothetical protein
MSNNNKPVNPAQATDAALQVARQQAYWAQRSQEYARPKVHVMNDMEALYSSIRHFKCPRP